MAEMDPIPLALKPPETIVQMASGLWMSRAIWAACRLGIAEAVGEQPIGIKELAQETGTNRDMLRRLLNALTAHGVFARRPDGNREAERRVRRRPSTRAQRPPQFRELTV